MRSSKNMSESSRNVPQEYDWLEAAYGSNFTLGFPPEFEPYLGKRPEPDGTSPYELKPHPLFSKKDLTQQEAEEMFEHYLGPAEKFKNPPAPEAQEDSPETREDSPEAREDSLEKKGKTKTYLFQFMDPLKPHDALWKAMDEQEQFDKICRKIKALKLGDYEDEARAIYEAAKAAGLPVIWELASVENTETGQIGCIQQVHLLDTAEQKRLGYVFPVVTIPRKEDEKDGE